VGRRIVLVQCRARLTLARHAARGAALLARPLCVSVFSTRAPLPIVHPPSFRFYHLDKLALFKYWVKMCEAPIQRFIASGRGGA
jgi:hypothetical protein